MTNEAAVEEIIKRILKDKNDYYAVMGIASSAPEADVKKAYKKLALKLHPDKCKLPGAEESFKALSEAFSILSVTDKRRDFDEFGAEGAKDGGMGGMPRHFRHAGQNIDPEEIFRQMFGGGFGGMHGGGMGGFPGGVYFNMGGFPGGGMRFQQFGGGMPRDRRRHQPDADEGDANENQTHEPREVGNPLSSFLPILLFILFGGMFKEYFFLTPLYFMVPAERRPSLQTIMMVLFIGKFLGVL